MAFNLCSNSFKNKCDEQRNNQLFYCDFFPQSQIFCLTYYSVWYWSGGGLPNLQLGILFTLNTVTLVYHITISETWWGWNPAMAFQTYEIPLKQEKQHMQSKQKENMSILTKRKLVFFLLFFVTTYRHMWWRGVWWQCMEAGSSEKLAAGRN